MIYSDLEKHPLYEYLKANAPLFLEYEAKKDELWEQEFDARDQLNASRNEGYKALYKQIRKPIDEYQAETDRLLSEIRRLKEQELEAFAKQLLERVGQR